MQKIKNYRIEITKKPKHHPLNVQYTNTIVLTKKDFLKLKREIKNDKENDYSILILSGNTEPLLPSEKIILRIKWLKNILLKNYLRKGNLVEAKNMFKKCKVG